MPAKNKPSIEDVARLAGVSTATVSRSINEPGKVKRQTLESVRSAVHQLGYTPHFGGRALASNRSNTIGALIPTMDNAIFALGLQSLQEALADAGVTLLIATSGYDPDREFEQIQTLLSRGVDGLMLIGFSRPDKTLALLKQHDIPVVVAWNFREGSEQLCVGFDNSSAAAALTDCVLDYGHDQIAMIAGISHGNDRAADRIEGVRQALRARGLTLSSNRLTEVPYALEDASRAMRSLMGLSNRPTAIVCGNDVLAAGALMFARQEGIAVPDEVSVVGFDDIDLACVTDPPLTTVRVPHRRMGRAAAELLLALRGRTGRLQNVELQTELVVRASLGAPPNTPALNST